MKSKNVYALPVNEKDIKGIKTDSPAHTGGLKYCIDYKLDIGTPIYAALAGKVIMVKNDSNKGGPDEKYSLMGNHVAILHKNREVSYYEHFKKGGVIVKLEQQVKTGQIIGYSGNTGWSYAPHLHFGVFKKRKTPDEPPHSLKIVYED